MAYGKKNHVSLNILDYNICILGQSKVGKTTLIKEVCEKVVGEDGYLFLEVGMEQGADCIEGINYVNCPEWSKEYDEEYNTAGFIDVVEDIIDNRTTDYKNLKTIVIDTYDQLINIAEQESIALWNRECLSSGQSQVKTINQAWGGFARGEKKSIELMFNAFAELKNVGISTIVIGHVKTKDVTDVVTGETYQVLTSDQQSNYFNALKKNLHFLGLAYIDREIVKEKTGTKIPGTKKDKIIGKVTGESRRIKFRDDNYAVDSGCRYADIVPEIEMNSDAFIKALEDAIKSEIEKKGKRTLNESEEEQETAEIRRMQKIAEQEAARKEKKVLDGKLNELKEFIQTNKGSVKTKISPLMELAKKHGYKNPVEVDSIEVADELLKLASTL